MDYQDLKYKLAKKGYTLTRVAEEMGLSGPQSIHQVLIRKYVSARVEKRIADIIGIPLEKLFPDRYLQGGQRLRKRESSLRIALHPKNK